MKPTKKVQDGVRMQPGCIQDKVETGQAVAKMKLRKVRTSQAGSRHGQNEAKGPDGDNDGDG